MKTTKLIILTCAISLNTVFAQENIENDASLPTLEDRYFGEKPPGLIPVEFAPDIVSPEGLFEGGGFSPDMKEFYFSRKNGNYVKRTFFVIRYENNSWGHESETDIKWPKFSEDGNTIFGGKEYRERTDRGWSEPKSQGEFLKDQAHGISLSSKGTYYFGFNEKEGRGYGSIRYSRLIDGKRENPVKMSKTINTGRYIAHPFIAPDESYLMWDAEREGGYGDSDCYISFRQQDGSWGAAINMGTQINTASNESSPSVTHDGEYIFFSRGDWELKEDGSTNWVGKPYWVDAQVIENLRPKNNEKTKSTSYTIAYSSRETGNVEIYLGDTEGTSTIKSTNAKGGYLAWSPDGKQFAFYAKYDDKKTWSIHTMNSDGTNRQRLTHEKNKWDNSPAWSPDGTKIAFSREYKDSEKNWQQEIWIMNSDGSELTQIKSLKGGGPYFTPDGQIVFHSEFKDKKSEISIANIDGNNIVQLTHSVAEEWHPEVSPDGKRIAFMSDRDGNFEIYVMNINGSNQKRLTNNDVGDWYPSWSPDGSQLIFSSLRDGEKDIYIMNTDGSSVRKIISNATSPAWLKIQQSDRQDKFPVLEGPYLGQKPPGSTAEVFAPGIVSTPLYELFSAFTPDMKEFYFVRYDEDDKASMIVLKSENNQWQKSIVGPRVGEPFISPDGKIMYLGRRYMERIGDGWSEIKSLGTPYKDFSIMRLVASSKGTYYFDTMGEEPIRYARFIDGKRSAPKALNIDFGKHNAHPWIAPDESYLIWDDQRESGYGGADIYISFKQQDDSWGPAINMGDTVNSDRGDSYATVTPDGKYILFNRSIDENNVDIYWVDAQIIETLRSK